MVSQVIWLLHLKKLCNCMTPWLSSGLTKNPCRSVFNSSGVNLMKARIINLTNDAKFSCVCLVIDQEFRHNVAKVAVDPQGDSRVDLQTTLTML